ncbi:uncharacterized protein LOC110727659 [Chenopodium quinoa]|uniref:uncharacterized protein LOC110727659 n=1 Tax=Chenopodium quinoa TaxID=63459 RepID=UPI000B77C991|nr:uncharacterized protein LOC110727659 [Chenopodium quinoa]
MENKCFGEVAAMIYVVEFQKCGLPHAHFLIVLRHMMHGPCGNLNPKCSCMRKSGMQVSCKSRFPRKFCDDTCVNKDGYPLYRRRNTGETVNIRGAELDNRWVIPYNPYLSMLFDCHINVEVCSTIKAVKYLYKYVYKGHDRIQYNITSKQENVMDEIEEYQSGRWISPCEAAWRIFGFDLFEMHPPVFLLPVHLPNMQSISLRPHERLRSVVADDKRSRTPLTEFFAVNVVVPVLIMDHVESVIELTGSTQLLFLIGGTGYLYSEFYERYRWHPSSKEWCERKTKKIVVGRLAFAYPGEGERFFLRLLLINVRSPTSFEDLRTVNSHVYATFQEAALKLGLLEDDDIGDLCMSEAKDSQLPVALRCLFATILIFCQPKDPFALWCKYSGDLSEDFQHQYPGQVERAK